MAARFEIKIAKNGDYMFNLYAPNGRVVATSETYTTLQNCKNGIESVKRNARSHTEDQTQAKAETLLCPKYELFLDKEEKFRFRLRASNGEIICVSQSYTVKASAQTGIASIAENAPDAETVMFEQ
ncbi:MAG: DUF1508 domain-containing protein [Ruminococcaceae bacterium]|nr:DUF1508 domain-containing protein [Oscillospiraceae bacterium]